MTCQLCGETMPVEYVFGHLVGAHDIDVTLDTWPDGELVVYDDTLTPADLGAGAA